MTGCGR